MPRPRKSTIEDRISNLVSDHIQGLVAALSAEIRKSVAAQIKDYLVAGKGAAVPRLGRLAGGGGLRRVRIRMCIAPNCKNPSKGPRFHYLCATHRDASKKEYEAWRLAKQGKASA